MFIRHIKYTNLHVLIHKDFIRHILTFLITLLPSNMLSCPSECERFLYVIMQENRKDVHVHILGYIGINFNNKMLGTI